jgi:hypothetical protein
MRDFMSRYEEMFPEGYQPMETIRHLLGTNAAYRPIDELFTDQAKQVIGSGIAQHMPRETVELFRQWATWNTHGRNSYVIGPETHARIRDRVEKGDVPTMPVPAVQIEFEQPPVNFKASRALGSAILTRGEIGTITFIAHDIAFTDKGPDEDSRLTVLLPSVFEPKDLDQLRRSTSAWRRKGSSSQAAQAIAREMMTDMTDGRPAEGLEDLLAGQIDDMGIGADGKRRSQVNTMVASLLERSYGRLSGKPNPLLPRAARYVLVAADEARRTDPRYAAPEYGDGDRVSRYWMEPQTIAVEHQAEPMRLP